MAPFRHIAWQRTGKCFILKLFYFSTNVSMKMNMMMKLTGIILFLACTQFSKSYSSSEENCPLVNELDILRFFRENSTVESWIRPVKNFSQPVAILFDFSLRNIIELDEKNQELYVQGWLYIQWYDEFRIWNNTFPLNCIDTVAMPFGHDTKVWTPNIFFSNSRVAYQRIQDPNELVRIRKDGLVTHAPGGVFQSFCKLKLFLFPYDVQKCEMVFEAWRYNMEKQYFKEVNIYTEGDTFFTNEQWLVVSIDKRIRVVTYGSGDFDRAIFEIVIKRKTEYFALTAIVPCLLIGAIELVTFLVPYDETVRLELSFTCLLAYSMFQTMITSQLPQSAERPPLLLLLISLFTVYIGLAIFFQGVCIYLHDLSKQEHEPKPGQFLQRFVGKVANFGVVNVKKSTRIQSAFAGDGDKDGLITISSNMPEAYQNKFIPSTASMMRKITEKAPHDDEGLDAADWIFIARVVDKISFLLFLALLVGTALSLLVIIPGVHNWGM